MRKIFTLIIALCFTTFSYGQLKHWSFNNMSNASTYDAPGTSNSLATFAGVGTATYTTGYDPSNTPTYEDADGFAYTNDDWTVSSTRDLGKYLEFTVTATGDNLDFSYLELVAKRDTDGPQTIAVYTDVDGYTTPVNTNSIYALNTADVFQKIDVNLNSGIYSNLPSLTIRIYGYDATSTTGTLTFDEIAFQTIAVLPVELAYFDAKKVDNTAALNWATYSEFENATYVIERSANGLDFEAIEVMEGAGTTTEFLTYEFTDENPINGTNYYRLQMIDFYGESTFSEIKTVDFKPLNATINLYPNPVVDFVTVDFEAVTTASITLFNISGQIISQNLTANGNQVIINTVDLENGQYFIRIQTSDNQTVTKQFIKL